MTEKGTKSKQRILLEAFKLFAIKPYDKVTFPDIEAATNFSRGALMYHFPNKEAIFVEAIDTYVFNKHTIANHLSVTDCTFLDFIHSYVDWIGATKEKFASIGTINMHRALFNIELQATFYYPGFDEKAAEWEKQEIDTWAEILQNAINSEELKSATDPLFIANLCKNVYYGTSYAGLIIPDGIDLPLARRSFMHIYDSIKA